MKNKSIHTTCFALRIILLVFVALFASHSIAFSQKGTKKKKARVSLEYNQVNGEGRLVATVKTKIDRSYQKISGIRVRFFQTEVTEENLLGSAVSDNKGQAILTLPRRIQTDTAVWHTYFATIENNPEFRDAKKDVTIKKAVLKMTLEEEDSTRWVKVFVGSLNELGEMEPASDVECKVYVKRLYSNLPIADDFDYTGEDGVMSIEFPDDIPGDRAGDLTIIAKVEDNDEFGTLETSEVKAWGIPLVVDQPTRRELWSNRANAPFSLMILVNAILLGVWGTIAYIIVRLFKVAKLGKQTQS